MEGDGGKVESYTKTESIICRWCLFRIAVHIGKFIASIDGFLVNGWLSEDGKIGDASPVKGLLPNVRHTLGDEDVGNAGATFESPAFNARHALGNGDRGEVDATLNDLLGIYILARKPYKQFFCGGAIDPSLSQEITQCGKAL